MTSPSSEKPALLHAENITKRFTVKNHIIPRYRKIVYAVDNVSLDVYPGETLGLVGESGCGKSTLGRCLMKLYDINSGKIIFNGKDITRLSTGKMRPIRREMQMVFQDPSASLNPRRRVRDIISEPLIVHRYGNRKAINTRVEQLMDLVGLLPDHLERFPHEFSGGQRQRVGIARALALEPQLIIADEAVSALDVSVQAQIVNLFLELQERLKLTYVFIAHDLSVVRQIATRTAVMYLGVMMEIGPSLQLFQAPAHPYTQALISAVPIPDPVKAKTKKRIILEGDVPSPVNPPSGCRFHQRCPFAQERCRTERPELQTVAPQRQVACHYPLIKNT